MQRIFIILALFPSVVHAQPICAIQGSGASSPYVGQQVTTEGIVSAVFTGAGSINGYYIEQPGCDGNENTSNGIFVYAPNAGGLAAGLRVAVTGTVVEFNGLTELTNANYTVLGTGVVTPTDVVLPVASDLVWERWEGMLLRFPGELVVVGNEDWTQYGEIILAPERSRIPTDHIDPNDAIASGTTSTGAGNSLAVQTAQDIVDRSRVRLDDMRTSVWPTPVPWADANGTLRCGSTVTDLRGVLHYSFGDYKVEPVGPVDPQHDPRPDVPEVGGTVRAAGFNVLNYFTTLGVWGAENTAELLRQRTKLVAALSALDADVIALCEIENADAASEHLQAGLNAAVGAGTYATLEEDAFGQGTRTIILYKPSVLTPSTELYWLNTGIFQRPHLTQGFEVNASGARFLFSTMHLRSKLCDNATGLELDQGDGQGCFNALRRSQVSALVDHWERVRAATGIEAQLIMGDLNAYSEEDPIDRLRASGLVRQSVSGGHTYSYAAMFGALDHAFATPAMDQAITGAGVWHINADEPNTLDYRDTNLSRYQANAFRSSDHDPVLMGFNAAELNVGLPDRERVSGVRIQHDASGTTWTMLPSGTPGARLLLLDARGLQVGSVGIQNGQARIGTGSMAPGVYLWRITGGGPTGRFVIP
ncbi:MAG: ExeM/NucH family extracellular endonuclease [Flavobacteriales bacterium]|nr:ExeM/NucH family extracellular endonuclease [Flavobacteriales bacterium]